MPTYACPTCGSITRVESREDAPYRPFCCRRCQLIDLYHWFEGDYRVSDPLAADPQTPDTAPPGEHDVPDDA